MQLFAFRKRLIKRWMGGQKGLLRKCKIKTGQKISPGVIKGKRRDHIRRYLSGFGIYSGVLILLRHCFCIHMEVPLSG